MIEIKNWKTGEVIVRSACAFIGPALESAVKDGVSLAYANLKGASLTYVNLVAANFSNANLDGVRFDGSSLHNAVLDGASLVGTQYWGWSVSSPPTFINGLEWRVMLVDSAVKIGCQMHSIETWQRFTEKEIAKLSIRAEYFAAKNKSRIMDAAIAHSADALAARRAQEKRSHYIC